MKEETDKQLDDFTSRLLQEFSSETPAVDFTKQVISKVEAFESRRVFEYKPLISKKAWAVVIVLVLGVFSYLIFGDAQMGSLWLNGPKSNFTSYLEYFSMPNYEISQVLSYGLVGFTFFIGIQVLLLKNHFDKRFELN